MNRPLLLTMMLLSALTLARPAVAGTPVMSGEFEFKGTGGATIDPISVPPARRGNEAQLLINGEASFDERFKLLTEARERIYIQALIFKSDDVGRMVADTLIAIKKKHPEMDIRIIIDAYSNVGDLNAQFMFFELKDAGIEVEGYEAFYLQWLNEVNLKDWLAGNKRYHEKYWIIDGEQAVVGGMNIANEYARFSDDPLLIWRDQDIYLRGPVVHDIEAVFLDNFADLKAVKDQWPEPLNTDAYWNAWDKVNPKFRGLVGRSLDAARDQVAGAGRPLPELLDRVPTPSPRHQEVTVRFVRSRPRQGERTIDQVYVSLIDAAERSVLIENAYFVPNDAVQQALIDAAKRGVSVVIVANSRATNDIPMITDAGRLRYLELIEAGAVVAEYHAERHGEGTVHAKCAVFDMRTTVVGSYNLDSRSLALNSEDAVVIDHEAIAGELARQILLRDLPWSDIIGVEQARDWSDPRNLPPVDDKVPVWNDPRLGPETYEYILLRQLERSL